MMLHSGNSLNTSCTSLISGENSGNNLNTSSTNLISGENSGNNLNTSSTNLISRENSGNNLNISSTNLISAENSGDNLNVVISVGVQNVSYSFESWLCIMSIHVFKVVTVKGHPRAHFHVVGMLRFMSQT